MALHGRINFKSANPLLTRDKMINEMKDVIKYQDYFYLKNSSWDFVEDFNYNIDLNKITRLYYLNYKVVENKRQFKMIARMTDDGQHFYVDLEGSLNFINEEYLDWCKNKNVEFKLPGKVDIFYCTDPAIFMTLVLEESRLTDHEKDSILKLLNTDNINIYNDYQNYIKLYTNSMNTRKTLTIEDLLKYCHHYYVLDNHKLYDSIEKIIIPKAKVENIGNINSRFAQSALIYNINR